MSNSRIFNQAARILQVVQAGTPADQALRESLTQDRHYTAPGERRGISRAVFAYFRWFRWLDPKDSHQKQLEAARLLQERFDKNPASFKPEGLAARAVPDWLKDEIPWPETLAMEVGAVAPNGPEALVGKRPYPTEHAWHLQLQREPVLWIRAKAGTGIDLTKKLSHFTPAPQSPDALRYSGLTDLYRTKEFQAGEFEIQDLASQLVGHACAPQPGETWWDACAGEGGKAMHLSDLMQGKGLLWVSDRSIRRLNKLKDRAARAKVFNYRAAAWEGGEKLPTKTKFDGVLVDAPCSGVGTWQRNPHSRWTTQPTDVHELAAVQARLLNHVAPSLKPGGRLIYAVCTLTRAETTAVADAFTAAHPEFESISQTPNASPQTPNPEPQTLSPIPHLRSSITLWPHDLNANGMFIAVWKRK